MKSSRLLALGVLAAVVLVSALLLANHRSGTSGNDGGKALYPSLKTEADSINAVRIFKAGDARAVELLRKDAGWTVTERGGYPADAAKIRKLILALSEAKIVEQKTSSAANYAKLGVEDLKAPDATGVRVELVGGKLPVNLIVGKAGNGEQATYVRRAAEAPSWLVNAAIEAPSLVDAWLRRELVDVAGDRVQSAQVTVGDKSYTAAKAARGESQFKVEGVPKGKEVTPASANGFATALQGLALSEVRTASEFGSPPPAATATFKTFDGLVAQLNGWTQDNKRYVSIATSYDEAVAKKFELPAAAPEPAAEPVKTDASKSEQSKSATTPDSAAKPPTPDQKVRDEMTAANQRLTGWVFEIPTYKYDSIFKPLDQLLKKDELKKEDLLKK